MLQKIPKHCVEFVRIGFSFEQFYILISSECFRKMEFCPQCDNMLYLKMKTEGMTDLTHYCQKCGYEQEGNSSLVVVSRTNRTKGLESFTHLFNPYTKYDMTIPRTNKVLCPQRECPSNRRATEVLDLDGGKKGGGGGGGGGSAKSDNYDLKKEAADATDSVGVPATILQDDTREILIFRVDEVNMKYVFYCAKCEHCWQTDSASSAVTF